ncbi:MAG: ATP-binding protein [Leptolyngbyaceae cyanobacterium]
MTQQAFTILIVDDNATDRETYRRYLCQAADCSCTTLEAELGETGLQLCQQVQPEIVLMDYFLPDLDGLEFIRRMQAQMPASAPAVIVATGQGNETIAVQTLKAGAEDYLVKGQLTAASLQNSVWQALTKVERQQQQQSEARFQRAIAEAPVPIFIHGEDGAIHYMSQAVLDLTGYDPQEVQTLDDWAEQVYGERQDEVLKGINRLYDLDRRVNEGEFEIQTKSGTVQTWLFSSAPLERLQDGTRLVISIAADVTQQKQTETALTARLRQQAVLTQLSQVALSGVYLESLFDQATQLIANSLEVEYCKILSLMAGGNFLRLRSGVGWQSDLVGQAIVSADVRSQAGYTLVAQQPVVFTNLQTESRFQGSALLTEHSVVSGMSVIIPGQDDRPFGVLAAHSTRERRFTQDDINFLQAMANLLATAIQRKHMEQELHQLNLSLEERVQNRTQALETSNQELEAFSYSVAHDLRAPLRAIQGFAQVLEEDYRAVLDDLGREYLHRLATSAENLDTLIQDLLTYSRLGRTDIHLQAVNAANVVDDILNELRPVLEKTSAKVEVAPNLPIVYAHGSIFRQVLLNLIGNALKFIAPDVQPYIWIESNTGDRSDPAAKQPLSVRIWVKDNGIGIAPQHQARIFNPFERLHGVDAYPGTGIGLAIVARGMQRMGGRVGVESDVNQGSGFWIELQTASEA